MNRLKAFLIICFVNFLFIFFAGNGFAQGDAIQVNLGSYRSDNLDKQYDQDDWFKVNIPSNGKVDILVDCVYNPPYPPADVMVNVYNNSTSNSIYSGSVPAGQTRTYTNIPVEAGILYLKFYSQSPETGPKGYGFRVYNFAGTQTYAQVTFEANTVNSGSMSGSNYAQVSYRHNGNLQTVWVWDRGGSNVDMPVDVDLNSQYSYTETSTGADLYERFFALSGRTGQITGSRTVSVNYYHQYYVNYVAVTVNGGTAMSSSNKPTVTCKQYGNNYSVYPYDGNDVSLWVDAGSYSYSETSSGSSSTQRWSTIDSDKSRTLSISLTGIPLTVDYYQQYKPAITLSGTDSNHTVSIETRTLYGAPALLSGIYNSPWSDWCDVGSVLTFSELTTGTPSRSTTDTRIWTVNSDFNAAVNYEYATNVQNRYEMIPKQFYLSQNYPNPFNPTTTIKFQMPFLSFVTINIYNIKGELVKNIVSERMNAGHHSVIWNGTDNSGRQVGSGLYIYRMQTNDFTTVRKMIFVK
ncbi:hypothetical protein AMJ80_08380 [bacterium SM23_31]|nr:MAG: hypothetical protein AMJ80_08380 [bacterium SM23_31]